MTSRRIKSFIFFLILSEIASFEDGNNKGIKNFDPRSFFKLKPILQLMPPNPFNCIELNISYVDDSIIKIDPVIKGARMGVVHTTSLFAQPMR
jgi:hypothetical protein